MFSLTSDSSSNDSKKLIAIACLNGIPGLLLLPVILANPLLGLEPSFFLILTWFALFVVGFFASCVILFRAISKMRLHALAIAESSDKGFKFYDFAKRFRRLQVALIVSCVLMILLLIIGGCFDFLLVGGCAWARDQHNGCLSMLFLVNLTAIAAATLVFNAVVARGVVWPGYPEMIKISSKPNIAELNEKLLLNR